MNTMENQNQAFDPYALMRPARSSEYLYRKFVMAAMIWWRWSASDVAKSLSKEHQIRKQLDMLVKMQINLVEILLVSCHSSDVEEQRVVLERCGFYWLRFSTYYEAFFRRRSAQDAACWSLLVKIAWRSRVSWDVACIQWILQHQWRSRKRLISRKGDSQEVESVCSPPPIAERSSIWWWLRVLHKQLMRVRVEKSRSYRWQQLCTWQSLHYVKRLQISRAMKWWQASSISRSYSWSKQVTQFGQ